MSIRCVIPVMLAALLTACAAPPHRPWVKEGGNLAQDQAVCEFEAEKAAVSNSLNSVIAAYEVAERRRKIMDLCMRAKGWTK